jgi:ABC-type multidrug transport system fused ATPase/permease subunit
MLSGYLGLLPPKMRVGLGILVSITALTTLLDGIAIALLVPLVGILLDTGDEISTIPLAESINDIFDFVGLTMTSGLLSLSIILIFVARAIGMAIQMYLTRHLHAQYEAILRRIIYRRVMKSSWGFFTQQSTGKLIDVLLTQTSRSGATLSAYATALTGLVTTIIYVVIALLVSLQLTLAAAGYTVLIVIVMSLFLGFSKRLGERAAVASNDLSFEAIERFGGMKSVKTAALDEFSIKRFDRHVDEVSRTNSMVGITQGLTTSISELLFLVALILGLFFATGTLGIPSAILFMFTVLFFRMFQRAKAFQNSLQNFVELGPALNRVNDLADEAALESEREGGAENFRTDHGVFLKNVSFAYDLDNPTVHNLSIDIPANSSTAIVGPSGAGKTTIIDLVTGLIDPDEGQVLIGDRPLVDLSIRSWRNKIAYITQGVSLFNDTVANNIAFGEEQVNNELLEKVLAQSGASTFVNSMSSGSETVIGERGIRLSGGQRQRITLARALYRQPDLLILDEATSELDSVAERQFQETVDHLQGELTILIVAHRLSTIMNVDNVVVIDGGTVVESGPPATLFDSHGIFHSMVSGATYSMSENDNPSD